MVCSLLCQQIMTVLSARCWTNGLEITAQHAHMHHTGSMFVCDSSILLIVPRSLAPVHQVSDCLQLIASFGLVHSGCLFRQPKQELMRHGKALLACMHQV